MHEILDYQIRLREASNGWVASYNKAFAEEQLVIAGYREEAVQELLKRLSKELLPEGSRTGPGTALGVNIKGHPHLITSIPAIESALRNAYLGDEHLVIEYEDLHGNSTNRRIRVNGPVTRTRGSDYFSAYDLDKDEPRTLRLKGVKAVQELS